MRLNDTNVARLKPGDVPYIVRDKDLPGFRLRVSGKNKVFKLQIDVRDNGDRKTIYRSLGKAGKVTAAEARAAALKIIADRAAGKISIEKLPKSDPAGLTFAEAWPKYRDAMSEPSPRTVASYQDIVDKFLLKRWPDTPLRAITRDEVKAFHKKISDTNGKYRANGVARIGNAIYKFARLELEAPGMSEANPFRSYKMHNKERARKWGMGLKSLPAWWAKVRKIAPLLREMNLFILLTATRRENAESLRWTQVNFEERFIEYPAPKGGVSRAFRLPMSQAIFDCLKRARAAGDMVSEDLARTWVFPSPGDASGHVMQPKAKGLDKSAHALRASWITIAGELGINDKHAKLITNHALPKNVHDNYAATDEWTLIDSMESVSQAIMKAIGR